MAGNEQLAENTALNAGSEITFDPKAGISEEEQREILAKINNIAERNRRSLAQGGTGGRVRFQAKRSGGRFPLLVNLIAALFLAGGLLLLSGFQGKTDAQVREGTVMYDSAERVLIEEIRKETASRIAAKESEIALVVSQLEGVDAELQVLHSSNQELSAEQRAAEERLTGLQTEYLAGLAALRDERSQILEDSRDREAKLRAQMEARIRELTAVSEQSEAELDAARSEMERISAEQEKAASIEAQMGGYFITLGDQIRANRLPAAAETLKTMRVFINTPAFQGLRSIQARKELYARTINAMEQMVEETRKNQAALVLAAAGQFTDEETEKTLAALREENARLQENVTELGKSFAAVNSQGSEQTQRLIDLQGEAASLRAERADLQRQTAELRQQSADLRQQSADLQQQNSALQASESQKNQDIASLQSSNANLTQTVSARDTEIRNLNTRIATLTSLNDSLQKSNNELTNLIQQQGQQPQE
jgi:chromosome segregation ATPase